MNPFDVRQGCLQTQVRGPELLFNEAVLSQLLAFRSDFHCSIVTENILEVLRFSDFEKNNT